jgi:DNA-binding GntR family transcriptional regulator
VLPSRRRPEGSQIHHAESFVTVAESLLAPIEYQTLNDIVTKQLRAAILSGRFPPGTALTQRDIADQLSVSRMPVREAFRTLELEGLIRGLPRRKAVVVTLQPEDLADIFDILATLEARAAEKAAPLIDQEGLRRLRQLRDELVAGPDDVAGLLDLDLDFHSTIYQHAGSRIQLVIQTHRNAVRPYWLSTAVQQERRGAVREEHGRIIAALEAHDPAAAASATAGHLRAEGWELVEHLRCRQHQAG